VPAGDDFGANTHVIGHAAHTKLGPRTGELHAIASAWPPRWPGEAAECSRERVGLG
jgi:hypothetical protein